MYIHQQKKQTISFYMINYYLSMILCYVKSDYINAIKHLSVCILKNPTMSEFWCLLGDIFYKTKQYNKALDFYENAKIIGQRRLIDSDWPMEISKYSSYPEKMIENTKSLIEQTNIYVNK
jgi:tetratricopeptide (TPR) repeat protein